MYTYSKKVLPKSSIELVVDIKKEFIKKEYDKAFNKLLESLQIEGFRKGKVPADIGKKHIKGEEIYKEAIQSILPSIYEEIVKKEDIKPIINPKIELTKAKENEDWQVKFNIAIKPVFKLPDLKKIASDVKGNAKKDEIWVPGKDPKSEPEKEDAERKKQKTLNALLEAMITKTKIEIPDLLIEAELEHKLTGLLDEVQKIGLTIDGYLKSKNTNMDDLKAKYRHEIDETYRVEFILNEIADLNNIQVDQVDLDKIFENIEDEKAKQTALQNSYFYASVVRKQKTLEYLLNL
ncbi:hypothetical protein A3F29_02665 [Candidatus Roizmanbacteria bacterium RIFCSPHIGHO2_12_FULL_33_9]|uniref:Trigger factor n=1 Tax=Candidatus Roizmanbacteria bacterium RIFCSPHIGHO2_12_FULL_33_9 TaxID=1802045 RepID=A0A1F7HK47_9BACT|nr:MAG: hypothetical protein A3F29_02665 [Candidatus Roizmanbacteria bacterium RIFCSPHIGHO2_12_FULL_33_9]